MTTYLKAMDEPIYDAPIYDAAMECEGLFKKQVARFDQANDANGAALIGELSHQFSIWANSMRVLDDGDFSLDRKVQGHTLVQEQILRVLDLMRANLAYVHLRDASPGREVTGRSDLGQPPQLSKENVDAVSEALRLLHEIEMAIQHSSTKSHTRRAREHTEGFDLSSFTQLASLSLQSLYNTANANLLEQLTISMTDTYRLFLFRKGKQESQKKPEPSPSGLFTIPEDPADEKMPRETMPHHRPVAAQSRPTTIDGREVASIFEKRQRASTHRSSASLLTSHVEYPKPANGDNTCEWCFKTLPEDTFEGRKWQEHVNEDHRPFVCISEKCMEISPTPRFPTWRKWLKHMGTHGIEWHRQVHPSQWRCPLCDDDSIRFFSPERLRQHFESKHCEVALKDSQKHTILRLSRASYSRPRNECPLCCLTIGDEKSPQNTKGSGENKKIPSDQASMSENEKNQLQSQTSQQTSVLAIGESDPKVSPSTTILAPETIARHVAEHLRTIMLLTLRIIAIDGPVEISPDMESVSGKTNEQVSRVASTHDDPGGNGDILTLSSHLGELAEGYQLEDLEEVVPELDGVVTWHDLLGENDVIMEGGTLGSPNFAQDDSKEPSGVPGEETIPLSFLFIVNKLIIFDPEWDEYHNSIPPHAPHKYMGEISSKVMRYSNGQVSEAVGYHWYRDSSHAMGHLFCLDSSGNYIPDNSTDSYHMAQQYETFAVFACNPLLPLMVTDRDPLVRETRNWQLLRIFHSPRARGLSQVVTLESAMGYGGAPVRYVAGKSPSWMPALIPETYQSPHSRAPPSRGLGGELGIVLGLMALTADKSTTSNDAVNEMFIERQQWHHNTWRGPKAPRGYPDTAQDDPNGFLSVVFLDPENPYCTKDHLRQFEWQTAIVDES